MKVSGTMLTTHCDELGTKTKYASHFKPCHDRKNTVTKPVMLSHEMVSPKHTVHNGTQSQLHDVTDKHSQIQSDNIVNHSDKRPVRSKKTPTYFMDFYV